MSKRVHLDFNKALAVAVKAPMVKIDRAEFLKNNFSREVEPKMVDKIVQTSPIKAGVTVSMSFL